MELYRMSARNSQPQWITVGKRVNAMLQDIMHHLILFLAALVAYFDSPEDLATYAAHVEHLNFVKTSALPLVEGS